MLLCIFLAFLVAPPRALGVDSQSLPVLLVNGAIYPRAFDVADLPVSFRADSPGAGTVEALYLLQCVGPVREDWVEEIRNRGAKTRGYLAHNTLVACMDADAYSRVSRLGFISWSGLYQPYYKVSPVLQLRLVQGGEVTVLAQLYDSRLLEQVLEALRAMPLEILAWGGDGWCGMVVLRLPVEGLKEVVALPEVEWVDLYGAGTLPCLAGGAAGWAGPPAHGGTEHGGGPASAGMTGFPETVAVADAGMEELSTNPLPAWLAARVAEPVDFRGGGDRRLSGHGTAAAMVLLAGDSLDRSQPEVKPIRVIPYATGYGLGVPQLPVSMYSLLEDAYTRGARVFLDASVPEGRESLARYGTYSFQRDAFAWSRPDVLVVEPAGNEGTDADGDGRVDGGSLLGGSCAKNVVSVGGCEGRGSPGAEHPTYAELDGGFAGRFSTPPLGKDPSTGNAHGMAAFSSRGPTDDGRIKPDLVAPATGIPLPPLDGGESSTPVRWHEGALTWGFGTSLAAALLAGRVALLRAATRARTGREPSAALLKALLVNGAEDLYPGQYGEESPEVPRAPNPVEGWGRPDDSWTWNQATWLRLVDEAKGLWGGDTRIYRVEIGSLSELRVTLAWTDYPSLPQSRVHLVNDLDLRVIGPDGKSYYPNGRRSRDPLNNTERVVVDVSGRPGKYTVEVKAWNVPLAPQPYALVVQGR